MATKDPAFSMIAVKSSQFYNLFLNQSHKFSKASKLDDQSFCKSNNDKSSGYTVTDNYQETGKSWNKSTKDLRSKTGKNLIFNIQGKEDNQKRWKNDKNNCSNNNRSSTLSLHIAAYESSFDVIEDWPMKTKLCKSLDNKITQNSFEFPRQQKEDRSNQKTEISQFKSSQRLLKPMDQTTGFKNSKTPPNIPKGGKVKKIFGDPLSDIKDESTQSESESTQQNSSSTQLMSDETQQEPVKLAPKIRRLQANLAPADVVSSSSKPTVVDQEKLRSHLAGDVSEAPKVAPIVNPARNLMLTEESRPNNGETLISLPGAALLENSSGSIHRANNSTIWCVLVGVALIILGIAIGGIVLGFIQLFGEE